MSTSGWTQWSVAYFSRLFFMNQEITFDFPTRIRFPKQSNSMTERSLAGTSFHQALWLGGNAPINLMPMSFELEFQPDSENELNLIERFASIVTFSPQSFCPLIWIEDIWYIPTGAGVTEWLCSRNLPYDILDFDDPTNDFKPKAFIDSIQQVIINTGDPAAGEVKVLKDVESSSIITPALAAGTYLFLQYPAKFYINRASLESEIPDTDDYRNTLSLEEHLINRNYSFSIQ